MLRTAARRAAALASSSACRTPVPAAPFSSAPVNIYSERIASPGAADGPTPDTRTMCVVHGVLGTGRNLATLTRKLVTAGEAISGHPWQAALVDQRCHGKSGALGLPPPHTLASSARDILRLFDEGGVGYATRMDVLIGHSLGGKVSLEITRQLVDAGRPPLQTWVLDAWPFYARHTSVGFKETLHVMDLVSRMPQPLASREELYAVLEKEGLSRGMQQWLGSNLVRQPHGGKGLVWTFDLEGARAMLDDYRGQDYTELIEHPAPGFELHVVRALLSERWTDENVALMRASAAAHSRPTPDSGTFHFHDLPNSGHWVHVDNPQGLLDMIVPCLAHVQ